MSVNEVTISGVKIKQASYALRDVEGKLHKLLTLANGPHSKLRSRQFPSDRRLGETLLRPGLGGNEKQIPAFSRKPVDLSTELSRFKLCL